MFSSNLDYFKQQHPQIFRFWSTFTKDQQVSFANQLNHVNKKLLEKQQQLLLDTTDNKKASFEVFNEFAYSGNLNLQKQGQHLIEQGRLGCLLLAGGQGTRLHFSGPKGTYPISVIKHKSLFQLCVEKVCAASEWAQHSLSLAVMTSPDNDEETRSFFKQHHHFGLQASQLSFFVQETLPLLDAKGHLFLKTPEQISTGADGNGHSLVSFAQSGILDQWLQKGIEYLHIILVDNPLADPFDAELVGFHQQQGADITLKCTEKLQAEEKVGLIVKQNQGCRVIEYSEMTTTEKNERRSDGHLKHCCANLSLFCFSLSFIQRMAAIQQHLPLHKAWKIAQFINEDGLSVLASQPIAWKFETFIFDWLLYTHKVAALLYPREQCFAPLKNFEGSDSPETVRKALQKKDKKLLQTVTNLPSPSFPFELAADFHYPTPALYSKWQGHLIHSSYIVP